jgi:hypothetical protein
MLEDLDKPIFAYLFNIKNMGVAGFEIPIPGELDAESEVIITVLAPGGWAKNVNGGVVLDAVVLLFTVEEVGIGDDVKIDVECIESSSRT